MVTARSDVAHSQADVAGKGLLDFKMIIEYRWRLGVLLDSQAAASRLRGCKLRYSGYDLQGERNICRDLRRPRKRRNVDAAPTDVVQQIVGHAEAGPDARLRFPKWIPGQRRSRPKEPLGAIGCEQLITNLRLGEQNSA